ncbi:MAG: cbb3-type cytochrome c oxidase N-terminal domain-containing protein [Cyclobacteriaceae bacterium]
MKKFFITLFFFFEMITLSYSQVASEAKPTSFFDSPMLTFYIVVTFLFVIAILVLIMAVYMLQVLNYMVRQAEQEKATKLGIEYKPAPSMWQRLWEQWNNLKPLEKESDIMLDHNYDGIRELDNHLPPWWKWLFYATIGFAAVYMVVFHIFDTFPLQIQEYENEVAYAQDQAVKMKAANPVAAIDETNVEATADALALADGKVTFLNTCATCHRKDGGGDIGPNLTDEYWLHGGSIKELFKVVRHGVQSTNMIAWEGVISPEKIKNVSSYILTMQGSNPPNPKKPQGELYKPEKKEIKSDTVKTQASL